MNLDDYRKSLQEKDISYSQVMQDMFALKINNYKSNGFYLDIGSGSPLGNSVGFSNSQLLRKEKYNWSGICIDSTNYSDHFTGINNVSFHCIDATNRELVASALNESNAPEIIDYLSVDVDDNTFYALKAINLDKFKFKCITIEHNKYLGILGNQRYDQRKLLTEHGYHLLIKNWFNFEDWWIHPELVELKKFKYLSKWSDTPSFYYDEKQTFVSLFLPDSEKPSKKTKKNV